MSTSAPIPPEDQPTRVTPPSGTPGGGAQPPGAGARKTYSAGVLAGIAVAVLVIAGLGGYLIGHSSGDDSGQKSGYDKGFAAGQEQVHAQYRPGQQAYETIYARGKSDGVAEGVKQGQAQGERTGEAQGERTGEAQGQRVGFEQGQRQGVTTGEAEGVRQGAAAVLGGFTSWTDGAFYIVTVGASSTEGVPYTITSRTQLQPDTDYKLCQDGGSQQVCQSAATSATTGGDAGSEASAAADGGATPNE